MMSSNDAKLRLVGSAPFARILVLDLSGRQINVALYPLKEITTSLAYTTADFALAKLYMAPDDYCLWLDRSAFAVSADEATQIRRAFEPLGLRIIGGEPAAAAVAS